MKTLKLAVIVAIAVVLTGCTGDPTPESSTTNAVPADATAGTAGEDCAALASASAQAHGDRIFVEAGGAQYVVDEARLLPGDRALVSTTVDQPDLVGYPQVQFLSQCEGGEAVLLGGYVPIDGNFELLFTTSEGEAAGDVSMLAP